MPRDLAQLKKRIGQRVKGRRRELGLSQEALAHETDVTPSYLSQIEAGSRNPSLEVLYRLAVALKWDVPDLLRE